MDLTISDHVKSLYSPKQLEGIVFLGKDVSAHQELSKNNKLKNCSSFVTGKDRQ